MISGYISTGDGHQLYFERHGNPDAAQKVIYLHGGPGAGCSYNEHQWFNQNHFDVVLFRSAVGAEKLSPGL